MTSLYYILILAILLYYSVFCTLCDLNTINQISIYLSIYLSCHTHYHHHRPSTKSRRDSQVSDQTHTLTSHIHAHITAHHRGISARWKIAIAHSRAEFHGHGVLVNSFSVSLCVYVYNTHASTWGSANECTGTSKRYY